jgi:serine/threonine protein kinase
MSSWIFADRYLCGEHLGQGGFGEVWLARDLHLDIEVALKLFRPGSPVSEVFYEAQLLTSLRGEHVLRVFNADIYQDIPFLVTEVAAAGSTDALMSPRGVAPDDAVRWVSHLLLGLDVAHGRGLIHRDVKPGNLFLDSMDHARLGDFGVAARLDSSGFVSRHGDPRIVSPEMYSSGRGDARSDIFSTGVTLYALLSGTYPFDGASPEEIEPKVLNNDYVALRELAPHVPLVVANRVRRAMNPDPALRFQTAREMREALVGSVRARIWRRIPPHAEHHACWVSEETRDRKPLTLCVRTADSASFTIETRRATGSRSRLRAFCRSVAGERRLGIELRDIFQKL